MNFRIFGTLLLLLLAVAGCAKPTPTLTLDQIDIRPREFEPTLVQTFQLREGDHTITVELQLEVPDMPRAFFIVRNGQRTCVDAGEFTTSWHMSAAVVPLYDDGDALLIVVKSEGTGHDTNNLWVLNPKKETLVGLRVTNYLDASKPETDLEEYNAKGFPVEAAFLQRMKLQYNFRDAAMIEKESANPEYAEYFWRKDNSAVINGIVKLRRYSGEWERNSKPASTVTANGVRFTAYFKNGVWAYDKTRDESFVVYHAETHYDWPEKILASGPYVLAFLSSDAVLFDTRSNHMIILPCIANKSAVESFAVKDDHVLLSDGTRLNFSTAGTKIERPMP